MAKKLKRPKSDVKPDHLGSTERRWMSHKFADNFLKALTTMAEGNDKAFDILMSVFEVGADRGFHDIATSLDDMNIRGEQIVLAWDYANIVHAEGDETATQLDKFMALVEERFPKMLDHINANWKKAFMEKAVPSGAHKWMHKKIAEVPANVG